MRPPRRLLLLRHGKSDWADGSMPDADRPLSPRGRASCRLIAEHLAADQLAPDLVLCSSARRTRETVEQIAGALPAAVPVLTEDRLYLADVSDLLDRLRELDDGVPTVLLVGHNPGIHALATGLLPVGERSRLPTFPTAALAVEDLAVGRWAELGPSTTRLVSFVTPRSLAGSSSH
ncbi:MULTISPECIES: histidine phosphatase family protein [Protofrankia]|uniref:Phosphohistidine phosphatase n=1 Tax=Protofrankia coriariae TaxID=1562887 RepID=A0ABR5F356_9ACTN|nr:MULTISPECIES: histidine phosphatase family protein [Protofrankia]KLL11090.1 phosphohistidine phosphatase [Protofrankia coriariae]ONH34681.1 phosphohistidine phosphatase [Protofrankia sp. BMG5.30]